MSRPDPPGFLPTHVDALGAGPPLTVQLERVAWWALYALLVGGLGIAVLLGVGFWTKRRILRL